MKVLVSFCLFGTDPDDIYYGGMLKNLELYSRWHPDWTVRVYVGRSVPEDVVSDLALKSNADIRNTDGDENQTATFWRFKALTEGGHDCYLFRDADSRPIERERIAVDAWINSSRDFHVMRDHPRHGMPMLAGLWGVKGPIAKKLARLMPAALVDDYYMVDQQFLRQTVWPIARSSVLQHVGCDWTFKTAFEPFPVRRSIEGFVGEGFLSNGQPRYPGHRYELKDPDVLVRQRVPRV